jgi:hypothetical protein
MIRLEYFFTIVAIIETKRLNSFSNALDSIKVSLVLSVVVLGVSTILDVIACVYVSY